MPLRTYYAVVFSCRHFAGLIVALLSLGVIVSPATANEIAVAGSGWGHGVGLSQYGAKAMGADGNSYEEILNRYFTGINIVSVSTASPGTFVSTDETPLWVGLLQNSNTVSFRVDVDRSELCFDRYGECAITARPGESYRFGPDGLGGCMFFRVPAVGPPAPVGLSGSCEASVRPLSDRSAVTIPFKARTYRHGTIRFRPAGQSERIHTVYEIGIDDYLKGLSEVPESWPTAAIEAQVVTSRSWAVRTALDRGHEGTFSATQKRNCFCNLTDAAVDHVFRGWTGEDSHPRWVAAVSSTARKVITYGGTVGLGLYSSSSGGWTESYEDVFGDTRYPYLVSVNDSPAFSDSAANPHTEWAAGYSQEVLAEVFGFTWVSNVTVTDRNASGSARTVVLSGIIDGRPAQSEVAAVEFKVALSLRSTTFDVTVKSVFDDVPPGHAFSGEILGLSMLGITEGCEPLSYCPDREVTRAEMAAFLTRALDLPSDPVAEPYEDDDGHALEADIETLYVNGLTNGCSATSYCPERLVTRGELAAFLVRGFDLVPSTLDPFTDDDGNHFEPAIAALYSAGIASGCTDTEFCPDREVTRGEMAAFLVRTIALVAG